MKKWARLYIIAGIISFPHFASSQCTSLMQTMSYDTLVNSSGSDNGYFLSFPKFDASLGTLLEVQFNSEITLKIGFELENRSTSPISNYKIKLGRDYEVSGPSLQVPMYNSIQKNYPPYALAASDGIPGSGPDYISVAPNYIVHNYQLNSTVNNTADYLGLGSVDFDYLFNDYVSIFGTGFNVGYTSVAQDTLHFTMTYVYCPATFLASDVTVFSAYKKNNDILIHWNSVNETSGRRYELEQSTDGKSFAPFHSEPSRPMPNGTASYNYNYPVPQSTSGKIVFRLKQMDKDGTIKYSPLRVVDLGMQHSTRLLLFPNPAQEQVQIMFSNTKRGDYSVDVYGINGQLLKRYAYKNVLTARLPVQGVFPKGTYLLRAINKNTMEQFTEKLVVK